jgi:carboxymethylenebutenolidase
MPSGPSFVQQVEVRVTDPGGYVTYTSADDGAEIRSYFVASKLGRAPAAIILRGVAGPDDGYTSIADQIAEAGFPCLVHRWQVRGDDPGDDQLIGDLKSAISYLASRDDVDASRIALFGFCKGGGQGLLAAAAIPAIKAIFAFHGFSIRPDGADALHGNPRDVVGQLSIPVYLFHGEKDTISPIQQMRDLESLLKARALTTKLVSYPEAGHGFAVSTHKGYDAQAAQDSLTQSLDHLRALQL